MKPTRRWFRHSLRRLLVVALLAIIGMSSGAAGMQKAKGPRETGKANTVLPPQFQKLLPLHKPLGKPSPGDWLARHSEPGQTYADYVHGSPVRPAGRRRIIYIQPVGDFNATQRKIVRITADYMGIYFQLPVRVRDDLPLSLIPQRARRVHPQWGVPQILTAYVRDELLKPRLPDDAVALIAFTASDLWPGEGWNFVFGEASLADRVGVWSICRFGDPETSQDSFRLTLRRTLETATHETGHMFSMQHCIFCVCSMCGSNSLAESDRHPLWLCPHCLAKLCYATGADPKKRFEELIVFAKTQGLSDEADFWQKSLAVMKEK
jgi:archaemetzincin